MRSDFGLDVDIQASSEQDKDASDDAEQVRRAVEDRRAFAPLYHRYGDRIWRYVLQRTGSPAVADDVLSETILGALESLERFDPERGSFATWIFTIASRRISDQQRGGRRLWRLINRAGKYEQRIMPDPLSSIVSGIDAARVRAAVAKLPAADREIVILRYSAELSTRTIANIVGLTDGAVRVRLHRARQRLATELEDLR